MLTEEKVRFAECWLVSLNSKISKGILGRGFSEALPKKETKIKKRTELN
jgi:hypothetical protein